MSKKNHAQHNEKVCAILRGAGECNDWVITTAFYSSLHYVQHEMFPYNDGSREYINFDAYYNGYKFLGKRPTRHEATVDLVDEELSDCGESYRFLFENCMTARYRSYQIPDSIVDKALEHLENIKESLLK